eukprot:jgi/Tetstr1/453916/TSEL_040835.t1
MRWWWYVLFAVLIVVMAGSAVAAVLLTSRGSAGPAGGGGNVYSAKVLAVLEGRPGSGKTTLCGYIGEVREVWEKDVDFFTQPLFNPAHPVVATPEGAARMQKWLTLQQTFGRAGTLGEGTRFIHAEILEYLRDVPAGVVVVFCGMAGNWSWDFMPDELKGVPRYLLRVSREENLKRSAYRQLLATRDYWPSCAKMQEGYRDIKQIIATQYDMTDEEGVRYEGAAYKMISGDGEEIIRSVLESDPRISADAVRAVVDRYRAQPTIDQRLHSLFADKFGEACARSLRP